MDKRTEAQMVRDHNKRFLASIVAVDKKRGQPAGTRVQVRYPAPFGLRKFTFHKKGLFERSGQHGYPVKDERGALTFLSVFDQIEVIAKPKKKARKARKARAPEENETRLPKSVYLELIGPYRTRFKLTAAQEAARVASRDGKPIRTKTVIAAYDQFVRAGKSRKKAPRQAAAYFVAAELAKDLRKLPQIVSTGKGDHPRLKEA